MNSIIIPLGVESRFNNDELRIALRSIEKHTNVDKVYVATTSVPNWLTNVTVVPVEDTYTHNKDNNLITKVLTTLTRYPEIEDFVFWSDDQLAVQDIDLSTFKNAYNDRGLDFFRKKDNLNKWHKRVLNTLELIKWFGADTSVNWESHTPVRFNRSVLVGAAQHSVPSIFSNYTINTLFSFFNNIKSTDGVLQDTVKTTYESSFRGTLDTSKPFIGYNDRAFSTGLREALFNHFPDISKYEKIKSTNNNNIIILAKNINDITKLDTLLLTIKNPITVFPVDAISAATITSNTYNVINVCNDTITTSMLTALSMSRFISDYCIIVDGNETYKSSYVTDSLNEIEDLSAVIDSENKAIFKTSILYDLINAHTDMEYTDIIKLFIDTVKNIAIAKDT